jgi:hypothetical protein
VSTEQVEALRRSFGGPMSDSEIQLLRDIQGFVEFSIRNGLSFPVVISALVHDANEVVRHGFDLQKAQAAGVLLKVGGFASLGPEAVGEPVEANE